MGGLFAKLMCVRTISVESATERELRLVREENAALRRLMQGPAA